MKIRKIHMNTCKIFQNTDLDFTHKDETQNFIVIAGINGSGKTTLLKDVIYHTFQKMAVIADSLFPDDNAFDNVLMKVGYEGIFFF